MRLKSDVDECHVITSGWCILRHSLAVSLVLTSMGLLPLSGRDTRRFTRKSRLVEQCREPLETSDSKVYAERRPVVGV